MPKNDEKRNARERRRVQGLNHYIQTLRNKLPEEWKSKKMSKLEIIQKSSVYIQHLRNFLSLTEPFVLDNSNRQSESSNNRNDGSNRQSEGSNNRESDDSNRQSEDSNFYNKTMTVLN
ncbi:hypothetical protein FSP39_011638 [Pinctada imbricata]|uniref:BHLH domain-containing protein n=1 Tax=Pinctada imbricata TaxID=66713 RepID=A0AA89CDA9_PINIB|nr:hypothetical protein FSP39_011638 [Pinctada imbricata]